MSDLEWAVNDDYSAGGPTKVEPGSGVKAEGQSNTTASVSAQELNWFLNRLGVDRNTLLDRSAHRALRWAALNTGIVQLGACMFEAAGVQIVVADGGGWRAISLTRPTSSTVYTSGTLTGTPAFSGAVPSCVSANEAVFVYGGYVYRFALTLICTRYALASITTSYGIVYSPYSGKHFVSGVGGGPNSLIESSDDGGITWAVEAGATVAGNGYGRIATDVTGQYILAAPYSGGTWAYSDDGGATWGSYAVSVDGDSTLSFTDLCYDDENALWLATIQYSSHGAGSEQLWYSSDPTSSWSGTTGLPARGILTESVVAACGVIAIDDKWIVGIGSASFTNFLQSRDQGVSWPEAWAPPIGTFDYATAPPRFYRSGRYVYLSQAGVPGYVSEAL